MNREDAQSLLSTVSTALRDAGLEHLVDQSRVLLLECTMPSGEFENGAEADLRPLLEQIPRTDEGQASPDLTQLALLLDLTEGVALGTVGMHDFVAGNLLLLNGSDAPPTSLTYARPADLAAFDENDPVGEMVIDGPAPQGMRAGMLQMVHAVEGFRALAGLGRGPWLPPQPQTVDREGPA